MQKPIETEIDEGGCLGLEVGKEVATNGLSFWQDGKVLKMDCGGGCMIL